MTSRTRFDGGDQRQSVPTPYTQARAGYTLSGLPGVKARKTSAIAEDFAGSTVTATITVTALTNVDGTLNDPVQFGATPVGGFAPLAVIFRATNNAPGTLQQVRYDFTGDNTAFLVTNGLQSLSHTYSNAGNNRVQAFDPLGSGQSPPFNPRFALANQFSPALSQPNAGAPVADLLQEELYIADTGNNRVILVKLPLDTPGMRPSGDDCAKADGKITAPSATNRNCERERRAKAE